MPELNPLREIAEAVRLYLIALPLLAVATLDAALGDEELPWLPI